jgi:pimeloyl-ACP methyl ester carboxylesterase
VPLTYEFRYAFANAVTEDQAKQLYETFAVPAAARPLFQGAAANFNPWTEAKVDTGNPGRGPMLLIAGEKDHTAPPAITRASYKHQQRNPGVTEMVEMPGRGHALINRQLLARGRRHGPRVRPALHQPSASHDRTGRSVMLARPKENSWT